MQVLWPSRCMQVPMTTVPVTARKGLTHRLRHALPTAPALPMLFVPSALSWSSPCYSCRCCWHKLRMGPQTCRHALHYRAGPVVPVASLLCWLQPSPAECACHVHMRLPSPCQARCALSPHRIQQVLSLPAGSAEWPSQASAAPLYYCTCAWHTAGGQVLWCDAVCTVVVPFHMLVLEVLVQEVQSEALIYRTGSSYGSLSACWLQCLLSADITNGALLAAMYQGQADMQIESEC